MRTQRLVFIPVIKDAGNDLFIDGIWYINHFEQKNLKNARYLQIYKLHIFNIRYTLHEAKLTVS